MVSLLLAACGCAGDDGGAPDSEGQTVKDRTASATSPQPTSTHLTDEQAQQLFDDALRKLVDDDTGRIRMTAQLGNGAFSTDGHFRLSNKSLEARVAFGEGGDERVQVSLIAIGQRTWFRVDNAATGEAQQCWTGGDTRDIAETSGYDLPLGALGTPPAVAALLSAEPQSGNRSRIAVSAPLFEVLSSIVGSPTRAFGIEAASDATVTIQVIVYDGELGGWTISVANLFRAVQEAGGTLPEGAEDYLNDPDLGLVMALFDDPGQPLDIAPPPVDQQCPAG